jgi:LacI family transcriptional regulator
MVDKISQPPRATLRQVAALSGVSLKTASRAMNSEPHVSDGVRSRVLAAAQQLGFRRNGLARDFRTGARSTSVAFIMGDVSNPFYARIARGAERRLRDEGLQLVSASSDEDPARERALIDDMIERRVSALLIVSSVHDHRFLEPERRLGTPVVFLDRPPDHIVADSVVIGNAAGMGQAVAHLLKAGHRRIGLVGDLRRLSTHRERVEGFAAAMRSGGIADWERYVRADSHDIPAAEAAVTDLLASPEPPTALITTNNRITTGALRALRSRPYPPALIGFDEFELAELLGVSVISHDPERMGEIGADLVIGRLAGSDEPPRSIVLPTRLVVRDSSERRHGLGATKADGDET